MTVHATVGQQFGTQARDYEQGRKPSSQQLLNCITEKVQEWFASIQLDQLAALDVGCGTGISTRALYDAGLKKIFGLDISAKMLERAKSKAAELKGASVPEENYQLGAVDKIATAFPDRQFSVITAFSAFHWFCTEDAVNAMKAAMTSNAIFIAVNGASSESPEGKKREFWDLIESLKGSPVHDPREDFHPVEVLEKCGFTVQKYRFKRESLSDFDTVLAARRSFSGWCNLTEDEKSRGEEKLRALVQKQFDEQGRSDGKYYKEIEEECIIAYRN